MSLQLGVLALVVAIAALGVAAYGVSTRSSEPSDVAARVEALEEQVAELGRASQRRDRPAPRLRGAEAGATDVTAAAATTTSPAVRVETEGPGASSPLARTAEGEEAIQALVEEAVEKKAREVVDEMRVKENKKPPIALLASTLELTPEQLAAVQENVRRGQFEVHALLSTPTADGSNLMDELVDVVAKSMAQPGKDAGWGRLIGRIMSEKMPGSDDTYGVRIEAVKHSLRETFKRDWTAEQYAEFEAWGVDPTEIQGIPGSPNEALMERIGERARELGAVLPQDK